MSFLQDLVGDKGGEEGSSVNPIRDMVRNFDNSIQNREISEEMRGSSVDNASFSNVQKMKIRQRSEVMARQFFPDKGDEFIDQQVREFQKSLNIDEGSYYSREGTAFHDVSNFGYVLNNGFNK